MSALAALQVPPVTRTIGGILASVLLDRLALGFVAVLTLLVVAVLTVVHAVHAGWAAPCIALAWALGHRQLARQRTVDPGERMIERAAHLAKLFPAAFVVMGHTHTPARISINDGEATYINVGSWAEEEGDAGEPADKTYRARTHAPRDSPRRSGPRRRAPRVGRGPSATLQPGVMLAESCPGYFPPPPHDRLGFPAEQDLMIGPRIRSDRTGARHPLVPACRNGFQAGSPGDERAP